MDVTVKVEYRLEDFYQPAECFDSLMRKVFPIVDILGWSVCDKNIQVPAIFQSVNHQSWHKGPYMIPHFCLRILVSAQPVSEAAFDTSQQYPIMIGNLSVHI